VGAAAVLALAVLSAGGSARGGAAAPPAAPDSLEGRPIRSVRVVVREVFDPVPPGRLRPVYGLANALHVRTREQTVRDLLLLGPGDAWSGARGRETARALRALDFLQPERVEAMPAGDSVDVVVETRDAWTTRPEFNLERGGGEQYGSVGLEERNLLGRGKSLAVSYEEVPTGVSRRVAWTDPAVFGTRTRFEWRAGNGSAGSTDVLRLALPFFAEDAPWTYGMAWRRGTSTARLFTDNAPVASFDVRLSETEVWFGRGVRRGGTVWRTVGSFVARDRRFGPVRLEPGAPSSFAGPEEEVAWRQFALEVRRWRPRFVEARGVEALDRVEDYDLGTSLSLLAGVSPAALGASADEGVVRARAEGGLSTPFGFGWAQLGLQSRLRRDAREMVRRVQARWVAPTGHGHHLVVALDATGARRPARDAQLVAGGLNGLRAYPVQALAGTEMLRVNAEQRWLLGRDVARLCSVGGTAFVDAARAWGAGAQGTGWFTAAGVGLRVGPPRTAVGPVFRADVAWPVSPTRDGRREAVLSFGSSQAF